MSSCSATQHEVEQQFQHEVTHTLELDLTGARQQSKWESAAHPLPPAAGSSTRWSVQFERRDSSDIFIFLRCTSVDEQLFSAAAARLWATVESDSSNWVDVSDVWRRGKSWGNRFPKQLPEWRAAGGIRVRARVQWSDVVLMRDQPSVWRAERALRIRCRWQLDGWKIVQPTAEGWALYSETFCCGGSVWQMRVSNHRNSDGSRRLFGGVHLLHLPAVVDAAGLQWCCTLACNGELHPERNKNVEERSWCGWRLFSDVESATSDNLELIADISITRKA